LANPGSSLVVPVGVINTDQFARVIPLAVSHSPQKAKSSVILKNPAAFIAGLTVLLGCDEGRPDVRPTKEAVEAGRYADITVVEA
jgi:hypothetical protein